MYCQELIHLYKTLKRVFSFITIRKKNIIFLFEMLCFIVELEKKDEKVLFYTILMDGSPCKFA